MELHRVIKEDSRKLLRNCWGKSVAGLLTVFAVYLAISITESILLLAFLSEKSFNMNFYELASASPVVLYITLGVTFLLVTVMAPLILGYKKLHFSFAEKGNENISTLFSMFKDFNNYFRSIVFFSQLSVRIILTFIIAVLPGATLYYFCKGLAVSEIRTFALLRSCGIILGFAIIVLLVVLWLIYIQRWFLAEYYFFNGEEIRLCFRKSVIFTKGIRIKILRFYLSFFGWYLISVLVFPILWVMPYCITAKSIYAKYLAELYDLRIFFQ